MSALEKSAYKPIFDGLENGDQKITCASSINGEKLQWVLQSEVLENPNYFYVSGFRTITRGITIDLYPRYSYTKQEINQLKLKCEERADRLIARTAGHREYEKALMLHDALAKNVEYINDGEKERYTIIGPFVEKKAVCEGFAKAYKYLLERVGIQCLVVSGTADDPTIHTDNPHAWNMVKIEGEWCHVDVTFDTTIRYLNTLRYDYFGLTADEVARDHTFKEGDYPIANKPSLNYYERNHSVIYGKKELFNYIKEKILKNELDFVVKLPDDAPEYGLELKVSKVIEESMAKACVYGKYSTGFNATQRVFHIHIVRI
ncbi:MAG: hypothetical protein J6O61_14450 [Butyrivibrio sp.]|uniref:transglutaminase domain-containing protein n=1 Tax=Butyrivibrio sp. TaxID=28121 RepID=UPI001B133E38|nr:transglutaminase domain-containing protein [Butyrivibrio sp.]MBO6242002.1 hypothetical protein [Butyrivibrio sp.]